MLERVTGLLHWEAEQKMASGVITALQDFCESGCPSLSTLGRILFVGEMKRHELAEAFRSQGFEVLRAGTSSEAIGLLKGATPVTMVIAGGGRSRSVGRSLLASLSAQGLRSKVPVVWLGTSGDDEDSLLRAGVSLFLRPPFPLDHLVSVAMFTI